MKSHDLARILLTLPDLPVATFANGHLHVDTSVHSELKVGRLDLNHIVIGNMWCSGRSGDVYHIAEMYLGQVQE